MSMALLDIASKARTTLYSAKPVMMFVASSTVATAWKPPCFHESSAASAAFAATSGDTCVTINVNKDRSITT